MSQQKRPSGLTPAAERITEIFKSRPNELLTFEDLIPGYAEIEDKQGLFCKRRTLQVQINTIRKVCKDLKIVTSHGKGYTLEQVTNVEN